MPGKRRKLWIGPSTTQPPLRKLFTKGIALNAPVVVEFNDKLYAAVIRAVRDDDTVDVKYCTGHLEDAVDTLRVWPKYF